MENNTQYDEEIDLRELFGALWVGKIKIIAITTIFAFASVIYALSSPDVYKATAVLSPAQSDNSDLSGALGQLGGLASFAGVSIGDSGGSEAEMAYEIMQSWSFIETFIADNDLADELIAAKGWNKDSNQLLIDDEAYDLENNQWLIENEAGIKGPPRSWILYLAFLGLLDISEDKDTDMVSVSIEHYSPYIAKQWVDLYVDSINSFMQQRQIDKVTRNISYLQDQIGKTSIAEMQEVFYNIIEEQIKTKMLAEANPDFAFVSVSPSMVPDQKIKPNRALICILSTMLGGILSALLVLVMHYVRKRN
ncbi:MAG: LPS O-antigen length regulator [Candidatus Pelagibacter sp.]|nr:LPS O-antigen length regulator [Candidatus Pelagibacter sp.]